MFQLNDEIPSTNIFAAGDDPAVFFFVCEHGELIDFGVRRIQRLNLAFRAMGLEPRNWDLRM
ncbi:hypothetical protein M1D70_02845 [Paenibacillus sp. AK002]